SPTPTHTLSLHDALPIYHSNKETTMNPLRNTLKLAAVLLTLAALQLAPTAAQAQVSENYAAIAYSPKTGKVKKAWNYPNLERARSEEHTSELQSPDHLVC